MALEKKCGFSFFSQSTFNLENTKESTVLMDACTYLIHDKRDEISSLLDQDPNLLLTPMPEGTWVKSKYTHLCFDVSGETILSIAAKLRLKKMLEQFKPLQDKLVAQSPVNALLIAETLSKWFRYQHDAHGRIIIPQKYIEVFSELITQLREQKPYDEALQAFREKILLKQPVKLGSNLEDGYWDVELLLHAAYQCHTDSLLMFPYWAPERIDYFVKVIGAIQSVLSPETAKMVRLGLLLMKGSRDTLDGIFSLYHSENREQVKETCIQVAEQASMTDLVKDNIAEFYRPSPDFTSGLGCDHFVDLMGAKNHQLPILGAGTWDAGQWQKFIEDKEKEFVDLMKIFFVPDAEISFSPGQP
jgi:DNA-binding transcriptional regulator/RsmH inhibitor MraZ